MSPTAPSRTRVPSASHETCHTRWGPMGDSLTVPDTWDTRRLTSEGLTGVAPTTMAENCSRESEDASQTTSEVS
eukprot:CAMPEP_0174933346 /NCGR_PEP_ID=MMETSP1355-20121228/44961_1 /TAXON_ID=464990 /ORGANISM="Hemiselmis tepida, Strain CCMP443" /LENGTH=73 /DNA_ID=CAMNT_0016179839 /DNA_START=158 /DNA_END=379 /DNA_ORIENTATION=-